MDELATVFSPFWFRMALCTSPILAQRENLASFQEIVTARPVVTMESQSVVTARGKPHAIVTAHAAATLKKGREEGGYAAVT